MIKIDALDFRKNTTQLLWSYILRLLGVVVFGLIFAFLVYGVKSTQSLGYQFFLNISIPSLPSLLSIILMSVDVILVLYLHELVHAALFYITHRQPPKIGMRGFVIFAAAPDHLIKRRQMIVNALAPFFVISLIGTLLLVYIPVEYIAWIFIPTLVNAAASGGDFMAVVWMLQHRRSAVYHDDGDVITAYSSDESKSL